METDQLRLNEMAYLHVPDKERSKSPSPADSLASSATDISTLPIHDRSLHRGDGEHARVVRGECLPLPELRARARVPSFYGAGGGLGGSRRYEAAGTSRFVEVVI
ncbi:hypothetical protein IscW_ISCW013895 [Ixodes scapularis]|uniref:Uncharacterized protein n=1 Tax=Ixodes scapularis TaxID=6945 RepID=B7QM63_IXOSC|nr:hypothetical protein IscW_ISCW013895 [Ixodes scapularis]|eukprot:XP_002416268.1 hypothetical protein IscW_ISCW013895 [Ixodes scapularis]